MLKLEQINFLLSFYAPQINCPMSAVDIASETKQELKKMQKDLQEKKK